MHCALCGRLIQGKFTDPKSHDSVSNCCSSPVRVEGKGSTHYYLCSSCEKPCDAVPCPIYTDDKGVAKIIMREQEDYYKEAGNPNA